LNYDYQEFKKKEDHTKETEQRKISAEEDLAIIQNDRDIDKINRQI